jgi:hypothetical protein
MSEDVLVPDQKQSKIKGGDMPVLPEGFYTLILRVNEPP